MYNKSIQVVKGNPVGGSVSVVTLDRLVPLVEVLHDVRQIKAFSKPNVTGVDILRQFSNSSLFRYTMEKRKANYKARVTIKHNGRKQIEILDEDDPYYEFDEFKLNTILTRPTILFTFYTDMGELYYDLEGDRLALNKFDLYRVKKQ